MKGEKGLVTGTVSLTQPGSASRHHKSGMVMASLLRGIDIPTNDVTITYGKLLVCSNMVMVIINLCVLRHVLGIAVGILLSVWGRCSGYVLPVWAAV